ncbi:dynein regulatory complex protein 11-like [Aulostomus maculatus]
MSVTLYEVSELALTYNKLWVDAQLELSCLLTEEKPAKPPHPENDREAFFRRLAKLYVRYIQVFRKLEKVCDQMIHHQKRQLIRVMLDGVMGRVLELKNEMVEIQFSEYSYMEDVLNDLKLTPLDLEIPIPHYFLSECSEEIRVRKKMLSNIFNKVKVTESPEPAMAKEMSLEEAVKIIQVAVRARQGRLRATSKQQGRTKNPGRTDHDLAALCIQKVWRGYRARKAIKVARDEEDILMGWAMDPKFEHPSSAQIRMKARKVSRQIKQKEHEDGYLRTLVAVTDQIRQVEGPDLKNTMKEQIRQWFWECRDATGLFPDYPDKEKGGSTLIFSEKTRQQLMEELAAKTEEESNKKPKQKVEKEGKQKQDKGKDDKAEEGLKMLPSAFLSDLEAGSKTFEEFWKPRIESGNVSARLEVELIKEEKRREFKEEIRGLVDEEMSKELAELKLGVGKGKGGKPKAKKKKPSKTGKGKKKEKDLTENRTLESLCEELVEQGLLKQPNAVRMKDFLGTFNYSGAKQRQKGIEPTPSLSDVRQVLSLYAVLPLGCQMVHEKAPLIKGILLAGPSGVGKKMLVHSICQETGASLFDLSPLNTAGKYPGKSGLAMMLHMVFKVARLLQPSVIWIEDAEKMFYKKVPKEEKKLEPTRLKKNLLKILKSVKGEDRLLLVGTTKNPHSTDMKSLCEMYSKIILIPRPDHLCRFILWKQLIQKQGGEVTRALDANSLAQVSDGYTPGHMVQAIQSVVTKSRILMQQAKIPLMAQEFLFPLAEMDPVFEEEEALKNWYAMTPLEKKRIKAASGEEEQQPQAKANVTKKGKK